MRDFGDAAEIRLRDVVKRLLQKFTIFPSLRVLRKIDPSSYLSGPAAR